MNELDLPPRRTLPPEIRDRIRTGTRLEDPPSRTVRYRAPLSVAAGVAVLVAGAIVIGQSVNGTPDDFRPGATPPVTSATSASPTITTPAPGPPPSLPAMAPDAQTAADLDRCGAAVAGSQYADRYTPRATWQPAFTVGLGAVVSGDITLIAIPEKGGGPLFCEVTSRGGVSVSLPGADSVMLGANGIARVEALYLSQNGLIAGVAHGVAFLDLEFVDIDPATGNGYAQAAPLELRDGVFVASINVFSAGDRLRVTGRDKEGNTLVTGEIEYDPSNLPVAVVGNA
jgi:hypothetical protein